MNTRTQEIKNNANTCGGRPIAAGMVYGSGPGPNTYGSVNFYTSSAPNTMPFRRFYFNQ